MPGIGKRHRADWVWDALIQRLMREIAQRRAEPAAVVLLLPYVQLIDPARRAWERWADALGSPVLFPPAFETTATWASRMAPFLPAADDLRLDMALDLPRAQDLLDRAGLGTVRMALAPRLVEAAWSLARVAAAQAPSDRLRWGERMAQDLLDGMDLPVLSREAACARLALAWTAASSYPTDCLFQVQPSLLVLVQGFQVDPLAQALAGRPGGSAMTWDWLEEGAPFAPPSSPPALHAARDVEDEAGRTAACVIRHLQAGRLPVALVAQDRWLTRRVCALLEGQGLGVQDETGWTLSTTRAAASVMGLLDACSHAAGSDAVLAWLKQVAAIEPEAVTALEVDLRRQGARRWPAERTDSPTIVWAEGLRATLRASRPLHDWQIALREALQQSGQATALTQDAAGEAVWRALGLDPSDPRDFAAHPRRLGLAQFTSWVRQVLETLSFSPPHSTQPQVRVLPLAQLLGQTAGAVVLAGCDEVRFPARPQPPGPWTSAQRRLLGQPDQDRLAQGVRRAWQHALGFPVVDVLWRRGEGGETLMPGVLVQQLQLAGAVTPAPDPRDARALPPVTVHRPQPTASDGLPATLSSSAYEDLRRCPYRFFALRWLGLKDSPELEQAPDKRDFGIWLHRVLLLFHRRRLSQPEPHDAVWRLWLDQAAQEARTELGLMDSEFLPFAAAWPALREGYLGWMREREAQGSVFVEGEADRERLLELPALGKSLRLRGQLDRIDRIPGDGSGPGAGWCVIDYKTESEARTRQRLKQPQEDTQLPFYAALLDDPAAPGSIEGGYLSLGERGNVELLSRPDLPAWRDRLLQGIRTDFERMAQGHPLAALGNGATCDRCEARGLCRRDFWSDVDSPPGDAGPAVAAAVAMEATDATDAPASTDAGARHEN
ncbi:MAG: PD-(D/E)XK nuclease family protein [Rhodoferax sp.]|nr:PD-(D/E)XK nuclease family protein [Rhodoferax sp.]